MKVFKNLIPILLITFVSCSAIKLTYDYKSRSLTWPRSYNLRIFVGEFRETSDSVFGEMELIGTEHNLKNVFVIEPRDFLRRAFIKEIQNSNLFPLAQSEEEADIILRGTLDKFYMNFRIHKMPQQPNGLEYKFYTEGWIKATMYVYQKDQLIYKIDAKSQIKDKGEMFLFGHWEDAIRDELDRMLQPMIFAVMDSIENFLSRR